MSTQKSGSGMLPSLLAIAGLVLFGAFTYFGQMFLSGGEVGISLLWAIAFTAIAATLATMMVVAKAKDEYPKLWRTVEFSALGLYILLAALTFRAPVHFFSVMTDKEEILSDGRADLDRLDRLFTDYEAFEQSAISKCETGLLSTVGSPHVDAGVRAFFSAQSIASTPESIAAYCSKQREKLLKLNYASLKEEHAAAIDHYRESIEGWRVFTLPFAGREMEATGRDIAEALTDLSASARLPIISRIGGQSVIIEENQTTSFTAPRLDFPDAISRFGWGNVWAWLGILCIHLLVIGGYLLSPRTLVTQPKGMLSSGTVL